MAYKKEKEFLKKIEEKTREGLGEPIRDCPGCAKLGEEVEALTVENEDLKRKLEESENTIYDLETELAQFKLKQTPLGNTTQSGVQAPVNPPVKKKYYQSYY